MGTSQHPHEKWRFPLENLLSILDCPLRSLMTGWYNGCIYHCKSSPCSFPQEGRSLELQWRFIPQQPKTIPDMTIQGLFKLSPIGGFISHCIPFFHNCLNPVLFGYKLYPSYSSTFPQGPLGGPRRLPHQIGPGARLLFRDGLWNADAPGGGAWADEIIVYTVYIVCKCFIDYQQNQELCG